MQIVHKEVRLELKRIEKQQGKCHQCTHKQWLH